MEYRDLEPKIIFDHFKNLCMIPHGSGNTEFITQYCLDFAKQRCLKAYSDEIGNVVIYKEATPDKKGCQTVILQGHLDMVCEKSADCKKDMSKEGISLLTDGKYVWADGTTLGADNGIAVAYMFAILDSNDISHPALEMLFTVDEEVGMLGARAFDPSVLKGKYLINLDSEDEGILTVSCAGGVRAHASLTVTREKMSSSQKTGSISISGLPGGHSGIEINKCTPNAARVMGLVLEHICEKYDISILNLLAGGKENAVPSSASADISYSVSDEEDIKAYLYSYWEGLKTESDMPDDAELIFSECDTDQEMVLDKESTDKVIFYLLHSPDGVCSMNPAVGMVQSSLNMGTVSINETEFKASYLVRGNSAVSKQSVVDRLTNFISFLGGNVEYKNDYPAWEYRADSLLRDTLVECYQNMYGESPVVTSIHAGLECGILSHKMQDVDMISFGPTLKDVHTPKERMDVESVKRTYIYLKDILKAIQ